MAVVLAALLRLLLRLLPLPRLPPRPRLEPPSSKTPFATARHQGPLRLRAIADAGKTHPRMKVAKSSRGGELRSSSALGAKKAAASAERSGGNGVWP